MADRPWFKFLFHHSWINWEKQAVSPFAFIKDHVLLPQATQIEKRDEELKPLVTDEFIDKLVNLIPDEWLNFDWNHTPDELRKFMPIFKD